MLTCKQTARGGENVFISLVYFYIKLKESCLDSERQNKQVVFYWKYLILVSQHPVRPLKYTQMTKHYAIS